MRLWKYLFVFLLLFLSLVVVALFQLPDGRFHLIACDVGQGDATLIVFGKTQILVDGGPDRKVLNCLGKYLPFWDREIELVILTHPDKDHYGGLTDVFKRYKIDNYLYNPIEVSSPDYQLPKFLSGTKLFPVNGQVIRVGMIQLDTLAPTPKSFGVGVNPPREILVADAETNAYSIVSLVSFKNFRALLTGDMTVETSESLATNWATGPVNYIKIPHHGSKNGLTENLLKVLMPELATISVGKNNRYGHPSPEIIEMLKKYGIKTLRTDEVGDIEITEN